MKITRRTFSLILVGQTIVLGFGTTLIFKSNQRVLRDQFSSRAEVIAEGMGRTLGVYFCNQKEDEAKKFLESDFKKGRFEFAQVKNASGVLASVGKVLTFNSEENLVNSQQAMEKQKVYVTFAELPACKEGEEAGELQVGFNYQNLEAPLGALLWNQLEVLLIQISFLFFGIIFMGRIFDQYFNRLSTRCENIAKGDLSLVPEDKVKNEFTAFSKTLNQMCESLTILQSTQEAQRAQLATNSKLTSLGEMASGVAHEINNPLAIIRGKAQLIDRVIDAETVDKEKVKKLVSSIDATVERIAKIIKGLKTFTRDAGGDPFEKATIKSIVDDTLSFCQSRFHSHEVSFQLGPIDESLSIECRASQISQVLLNLLNNAFDAVSELKEKWVSLEIQDQGDFVRLLIKDSGKGIPPEIREKILQPFFTTKPVGKGTGLGLSITSGIVKSHQGSFSIDTKCENTCFVIHLPKRHVEEQYQVA